MKTKIALLSLCLCVSAFQLQAQQFNESLPTQPSDSAGAKEALDHFPLTPTPAPDVANVEVGSSTNGLAADDGFQLTDILTGHIGEDIKRGLQDLVGFVEQTTNSGILTAEAGVLYAQKSKAVGGFVDAYLPIGGTNSIFGAGFGVAYLDHNFYDGTLNARIGDQFTLPFIKLPVYAYIESGAGYNFSKKELVTQAFSGALFKIPVTKTSTFTFGGAIGTISDVPGNIYAGAISYTFSL